MYFISRKINLDLKSFLGISIILFFCTQCCKRACSIHTTMGCIRMYSHWIYRQHSLMINKCTVSRHMLLFSNFVFFFFCVSCLLFSSVAVLPARSGAFLSRILPQRFLFLCTHYTHVHTDMPYVWVWVCVLCLHSIGNFVVSTCQFSVHCVYSESTRPLA